MHDKKIITQIGSLPHDNAGDAVAYSLKHDIPFLPELPKLGDSMLEYIKSPGKLSCLPEFKKHEFETVKVQSVGPATLILSGYSEDEAVERVYGHVSAVMEGLKSKETILFLDEPALGHCGFDFKSLWDAVFSSFDAVSGIHTCGNMDWDELFKSGVSIISFNAAEFDLTGYSNYRSGKRLAWGIEKASDVKDFREGDLITLPCGMGTKLYSVSDCGPCLENLRDAAAALTS